MSRASLVAALAALTILACFPAQAQDPDDGIVVGKFILAPVFEASWGVDDNLFRTENNQREDAVQETSAGIEAWMPFGNSSLAMGFELGKANYRLSDFSRNTSKRGDVELELNFSSGDTLTFSENYVEDFSRVEDQSELTFNGVPWERNRLELVLSRDDSRRQGYAIRIRQLDFAYQSTVSIPGFFNYDGFDNYFEYRRPAPGRRLWVARYQTRRFDHFLLSNQTGTPDRKELTDSIQLGLQGYIGRDQPYVARIGFARFRYKKPGGGASSTFNGLVGYFAWQLAVGSRTEIELEAIRRPLPSNFDTFYVNNAVKSRVIREWRDHETGADLTYNLNDYADPIGDCNRRDSTYELEVFWDWEVHERFDYGVEVFHTHRSSTCDIFTYRATGLSTGIKLGW